MRLAIKNLSKKYSGSTYALKEFSLDIETGILGLLGPNGAGKSTLMKMIATVTKPTSGQLLLNKNNIVKDPNYMRSQIGFLPQDFGVYPNLNAFEFLEYVAAMKGVGGASLKKRIRQLIEGLNLIEVAKNPISSYSGGMKQRVGIAQALLNEPKVIIFDEPTVGLDPEERVRFRNLITDLANDCIVILSSHIVSDIDTIADRVAVMKDGQLVISGTQESLIAKVQGLVYERNIETTELVAFKNSHRVISTSRKAGKLNVRYITNQSNETGQAMEANLEDAYLFLTQN